jgi:arylformamidase
MVHDITPPVSERLAVWPGDAPPRRAVSLDMREGANITLSSLHATVHLGAHADAPSHYGLDAPSIDMRDIDLYVGRCQVIRVEARRATRIAFDQIQQSIEATRVLIRTGTFPDPNCFNEDFAALEPDCIDNLHARGVRLIGIDTPSVDLFDSHELPAHRAILRHDMAILEGLVLENVAAGIYELIALPLRLVGFDASPVRAVLRTLTV